MSSDKENVLVELIETGDCPGKSLKSHTETTESGNHHTVPCLIIIPEGETTELEMTTIALGDRIVT